MSAIQQDIYHTWQCLGQMLIDEAWYLIAAVQGMFGEIPSCVIPRPRYNPELHLIHVDGHSRAFGIVDLQPGCTCELIKKVSEALSVSKFTSDQQKGVVCVLQHRAGCVFSYWVYYEA
jgi:hypothetical protein